MARPVQRPRGVVGFSSPSPRHAAALCALLPRHQSRLAMSFGPLVRAGWLHEHLHDPGVRVIDFRWYLLERKGRDEYARGHIPGAVFVDLEAVTGEKDSNARGRHPLPTRGQFESEMRKAGVDETTKVVVYDDSGASIAARLWFLLGWFGHGAQGVLDGGMQAWGKPLETSITIPAAGSFQ